LPNDNEFVHEWVIDYLYCAAGVGSWLLRFTNLFCTKTFSLAHFMGIRNLTIVIQLLSVKVYAFIYEELIIALYIEEFFKSHTTFFSDL